MALNWKNILKVAGICAAVLFIRNQAMNSDNPTIQSAALAIA